MNTVQPIREISQIHKIEDILKKSNYRNYILFKLGIYSGYRISDIIKLKVSDIKGKNYFETTENKTSKKRKVIIHPTFKDELDLFIKGKKDNEYLFSSKKFSSTVKKKTKLKNPLTNKMNTVYIDVENESPNSPIGRVQAYRILKDAFKQIESYDTATHTLRKTFGYHLYENSKDIVMVQKILGHSSPEITLRYIGILQSDEDNLVCSLTY
jgi:integrase